MREGFEQSLGKYSKFIKEEKGLKEQSAVEQKKGGGISEKTQRLITEVETELRGATKDAATEQDTSTKTQKKIFDIQRTKQHAMDKLRMRLGCLDNPEC